MRSSSNSLFSSFSRERPGRQNRSRSRSRLIMATNRMTTRRSNYRSRFGASRKPHVAPWGMHKYSPFLAIAAALSVLYCATIIYVAKTYRDVKDEGRQNQPKITNLWQSFMYFENFYVPDAASDVDSSEKTSVESTLSLSKKLAVVESAKRVGMDKTKNDKESSGAAQLSKKQKAEKPEDIKPHIRKSPEERAKIQPILDSLEKEKELAARRSVSLSVQQDAVADEKETEILPSAYENAETTTRSIYRYELFGSPEWQRHHEENTTKTKCAPPSPDVAISNSSSPWPSTPPRLFTIRGERHMGTNWIRELINRNSDGLVWKFSEEDPNWLLDNQKKLSSGKRFGRPLPVTPHMDADGLYGWKHGFLDDSSRDRVADNDVLLVITRDAFYWLASMLKESYSKMMRRTRLMSEFLKRDWKQECLMPAYYKDCNTVLESATNVVQLRTAKYKNWLGFDGENAPRSRNFRTTLVRYETILDHGPEVTIPKLFAGHCVPLNPTSMSGDGQTNIDSVEGYAKYGQVKQQLKNAKGRVVRQTGNFAPKSVEDILSQFGREDVEFVLSELDLEFEAKVLNYTYDYVREYLEKNRQDPKSAPFKGDLIGGIRRRILPQELEEARKQRMKRVQERLEQRKQQLQQRQQAQHPGEDGGVEPVIRRGDLQDLILELFKNNKDDHGTPGFAEQVMAALHSSKCTKQQMENILGNPHLPRNVDQVKERIALC